MASRSAPIVAALATAALMLSGCGGGGTHECKNKGYQVKTQSFSGQMSAEVKQTGQQDVDMTLTGTLSNKFDLDNVNAREDVQKGKTSISLKLNGTEQKVDVTFDLKSFVSIDKHVAAASIDGTITVGGSPAPSPMSVKGCYWIDIEKVMAKVLPGTKYDPATIKSLVKTLATAATQNVQCKSNDGTYDKFEVDETIPGSSPSPVPVPPGYKLDAKITMTADSAYMLHSLSAAIDINTPEQKVGNETIPAQTVHESLDLTVDGSATATGPSDGDLSYSTWGNCTEVKIPNSTASLKDLFDATRSKVFGRMIPGLKVPFPETPSSVAHVLTAIDGLKKLRQPVSAVVV